MVCAGGKQKSQHELAPKKALAPSACLAKTGAERVVAGWWLSMEAGDGAGTGVVGVG